MQELEKRIEDLEAQVEVFKALFKNLQAGLGLDFASDKIKLFACKDPKHTGYLAKHELAISQILKPVSRIIKPTTGPLANKP